MDNTMIKQLRTVMAAFIRADSRSITLQRPTFKQSAAGGYTVDHYTAVPAQQFRLVPYRRRLTDLTTPTADGEVPTIPYALVGLYNSNIQRNDEFVLDGVFYRVQGLEPHTNDSVHTDRKVAQLIALDEAGVDWAP